MRMITLVTALAAFWLLLSGHYTTWVNSLGALSVLLVSYIVLRMDHTDSRPVSLRLGWCLLKYFVWLFGQVISANIAVARRVLQPKMPIKPVWEKVGVKVDSPLQKTLYANSVTLTPDTLTMHIDDEYFLVHALWPESIEGLREGDMQRRVQETGI
jgi:multicomponent Na+:H+ antiporter subunit E